MSYLTWYKMSHASISPTGFHAYSSTHMHLFPLKLNPRKYWKMMKELKTLGKAIQNYLLGSIRLNYSCLPRLLSHHSDSHNEGGKSISLPSNVFNHSPWNYSTVQLYFPEYFTIGLLKNLYDGFIVLFGREIFLIWKNALNMKHDDILHGVQWSTNISQSLLVAY